MDQKPRRADRASTASGQPRDRRPYRLYPEGVNGDATAPCPPGEPSQRTGRRVQAGSSRTVGTGNRSGMMVSSQAAPEKTPTVRMCGDWAATTGLANAARRLAVALVRAGFDV